MSQRYWCVTWNNPPLEYQHDPEELKVYFADSHVAYCVYQLEEGSEGTRHFQMYFEFKKTVAFGYIKKLLNDKKLHCEISRTRDAARLYCMKEDSRIAGPFEYGTWQQKGQGRRSDLDAVVDVAYEGKSLAEAYDVLGSSAYRYAKYFSLAKMTASLAKPRVKPVVIVHWGDSGTGKTHDAIGLLEPSEYFIKAPGKWWDGYDGQRVVLIDDLRPSHSEEDYGFMLRLLDVYKMAVEIKGSTANFNPEIIYITSNVHPNSWYPNILDKKPLFRRITSCFHYTGDFFAGTSSKTQQNLTTEFIL